MNNCLLIVPPEKKAINTVEELTQEGIYPPLGLAYIAAALKNDGVNVEIIDSLAENLTEEELLNKIRNISPEIIGITVLTQQVEMALSIAEKIKESELCQYIVLGGPHIHFEHSSVIKNKYIDICVRGEGERTFPELVNTLKDGGDLSKVKGITYMDKNCRIVITEDRPFIQNLDHISFPSRELLNNSLYKAPIALGGIKPFTSILATRGCPYNCHFCSLTKMWSRRQRRRSVDNVLDEIEELYKNYRVRSISFVDDLLVLNREWAIELCRGMCKRGLNKKIIWDCCGRIKLMTPELLRELKRAGCRCINYGIEFGNQRMLDFVRKGFKIDDVRRTISMTNKAGIPVKGLFMMGYPTETKDTLQDTINLAKSLKMDFLTVSIVAPYPGTDLYKYCLEHNMLEDLDWIDIMQLRYKAIKLEHLSLEEVIEYSNKLNSEYMLRPSYMIGMLLKHPKEVMHFGPKLLKKLILSRMKNKGNWEYES